MRRNRRPFSPRSSLFGVVLATVLALGGCSPGSSHDSSVQPVLDSGVSGLTVAGPQCPVQVAGQPCPPKPVSANVVVEDNAGHEVTAFMSDAQGRFRLALPPGDYVLVSGDPVPPFLKPVQVTVVAGRYVDLQLMLDTGIR